jgi:hypothetical protein
VWCVFAVQRREEYIHSVPSIVRADVSTVHGTHRSLMTSRVPCISSRHHIVYPCALLATTAAVSRLAGALACVPNLPRVLQVVPERGQLLLWWSAESQT